MSFRVALSGLNAASAELGVTANNIANVNTTGFKESRAEFAELFPVSSYGVAANATGAGTRLARVAQQFEQGSVSFTNNALDLAISGEGFFTLSDNGATVYSRAGAFGTDRNGYVVNASGQRLQVFPPIDGATGFDTARLADLQLSTGDNPPLASSRITAGVNLPASAEAPATGTFDATDPTSYNFTRSVTVYDSLGAAHTANLFFVKGANANEWNVHAQVDGTDVGGANALTFSDTGTLLAPAGGTIALPGFTPGTGAADLALTLDLSSATQFGDNFSLAELSQDGYATGRLTGIEITQEGVVQARYTNGQATPLGQLAMANFPNPQGLQQLGNNAWGESFAAGQVLRGAPGETDFGLIQAGALEGSNVDLTEQLVNMITAQRNFQANAQMISTTDQITQTVINIR
ncbi:MAG: flagellar hook protein FlgE [Sinimarinibacterium flocculans]|uniref:Flagellar hook protein FlgE n=1 Tax=Sinimarinibacterium flocculans TaxID=985250 RepID=A0A318EDE0_9GAMM|nr:flagellar hook protein FlgE [Sinimarinibacterium flocculans]PXV65771.1 flagellar hook protein FlgE [Sinimarinibacterium flocculans]